MLRVVSLGARVQSTKRYGALKNKVEVRFRFAEEMVERALFELTDGRASSARIFIIGAIDQLDAAQGLIWEFERMEAVGLGVTPK
jgi:hypothetical protein